MSEFEKLTLILQSAVALLAFATLLYLHLQVRAMAKQILATQDGNRAQSALAVVNFLQSTEARASRKCVRSVLSTKHHSHWTEEERDHASLVCANYDVAAALLRSGVAPVDLVVANWAPSILHCHQILSPYISDLRAKSGGDPNYWSNFDWLRLQASGGSSRKLELE